MDCWRATDEQLKAIAERKHGKPAMLVMRQSGLWANVKMVDGIWVTVYELELN